MESRKRTIARDRGNDGKKIVRSGREVVQNTSRPKPGQREIERERGRQKERETPREKRFN